MSERNELMTAREGRWVCVAVLLTSAFWAAFMGYVMHMRGCR